MVSGKGVLLLIVDELEQTNDSRTEDPKPEQNFADNSGTALPVNSYQTVVIN
jgi:hypothetical protein